MGSAASIPSTVSDETREALNSLPNEAKKELDELGMQALDMDILSEETRSVIDSLPTSVQLELQSFAAPSRAKFPGIDDIQKSTSVSCVEWVQRSFEVISDHDKEINCCIEILKESALAQAQAADERLSAGGARRPLEGVPVIIKCNVDVAGTLSTAGTPALADWRPDSTAPVAQKLIDAGAIVVAKTTMPEFAVGPLAWSKVHGLTVNCHNRNFTAGGSSTGTAQGIAAGYCCVGLGSDTEGSLRGPAELAGIVALRPSRGRYPCEGVVPCDIGHDTVGPMACSVRDLAVLDAVISGEVDGSIQYNPAVLTDIVVAMPPDWCEGGSDGQIQALGLVSAAFEKQGARVKREGTFADVHKSPKGMPPISYREEGLHNYCMKHEGFLTKTADEILEGCFYPEVRGFFKNPVHRGGPQINMLHKAGTDEYNQLQEDYNKAIEEWEQIYCNFFESLGAEVLLTPCLSGLPEQVDMTVPAEEQYADFSKTVASLISCYRPLFGLNALRVPTLAMPTKARSSVVGASGPALPAGVLLWAKPGQDRRLIEIAMALELAMHD